MLEAVSLAQSFTSQTSHAAIKDDHHLVALAEIQQRLVHAMLVLLLSRSSDDENVRLLELYR